MTSEELEPILNDIFVLVEDLGQAYPAANFGLGVDRTGEPRTYTDDTIPTAEFPDSWRSAPQFIIKRGPGDTYESLYPGCGITVTKLPMYMGADYLGIIATRNGHPHADSVTSCSPRRIKQELSRCSEQILRHVCATTIQAFVQAFQPQGIPVTHEF